MKYHSHIHPFKLSRLEKNTMKKNVELFGPKYIQQTQYMKNIYPFSVEIYTASIRLMLLIMILLVLLF